MLYLKHKVKHKFELFSSIVALIFFLFSWFGPESLTTDFLFSPTATPYPTAVYEQNVVVRVIDGDTIELSSGQRVRYIGIDTPERDECFYLEAKAVNEQLVLNKKVKLVKDVSETDKYGRLLRYVYVENIFVNQYLVKEGYAYAATYPPDVSYAEDFVKAQETARNQQKGFWKAGECE